jgi:hypothetical protein
MFVELAVSLATSALRFTEPGLQFYFMFLLESTLAET